MYCRDDEEWFACQSAQALGDRLNGNGPSSRDPTYLYCYYPGLDDYEDRKKAAAGEYNALETFKYYRSRSSEDD